MERLQLVKWYAEGLHRLLLEDPNNVVTVRITVDLERVFLNSEPYKGIEALPPKGI